MKLIITRHGETEENKKGILQGHLPGKLTDLGKEQARKLALRLKKEKIDAIYSSDLARAADTANEIAKFHPNANLTFVEELRERNQGSLSGKFIHKIDWSKPKDTENSEKMLERANNLLKKVLNSHKDETVLFVSHGGLIGSLLSLITNKPLEEIKKMKNMGNAAVSIFDISHDGKHEVILLDCDKHLV